MAASPDAYDSVVTTYRQLASERRAVRSLVTQRGHASVADDVEHLVSELVANALEHGRDSARLHVGVTATRIVVEVSDPLPHPPRPRLADDSDERGRGLHLASALSSRWGVRSGSGGKTVWAEIALSPTGRHD
jgi:anti-sigma regulatory factor (Ser/Thr protein kinase)